MYNLLSYIKFIWSSANVHGVHSPFVYRLYTKGFKNKKIKHKNKVFRVLYQLIDFLEIQSIYLAKNTLFEVSDQVEAIRTSFDKAELICCSTNDQELIQRAITQSKSPIFITEPYSSSNSTNLWNQVCKDPRIQVSIDAYHLGILFIRPQQQKEHFKLRL